MSTPEPAEIIEKYRPLLTEKLIAGQVLPYLTQFLPNEFLGDLGAIARAENTTAVNELLDALIRENIQGWFAGFLASLEKTKFGYLSDLLRGFAEPKDDSFTHELISVFLPELIKIDCNQIMPYLLSSGCITHLDRESVVAYYNNHGPTSAALFLIQEHLSKKSENWFPKFIFGLNECGYNYLAKLIEPKFSRTRSEQHAQALVASLHAKNLSREMQRTKKFDADDTKKDVWDTEKEKTPNEKTGARRTTSSSYPHPKSSYMQKNPVSSRRKSSKCAEGPASPTASPAAGKKDAISPQEVTAVQQAENDAVETSKSKGKPCMVCRREREEGFPCSGCNRKILCQRCSGKFMCKKCKKDLEI